MKKYALRHIKSGKLLGFIATSNSDGAFCVDVAFTLDLDEQLWTVDSRDVAEKVRKESEKWYNAHWESPQHNFKANELEVVELNITIT